MSALLVEDYLQTQVLQMPEDEVAEALTELDEHMRVEILENLDPDKAASK